MTVLNPTRRLPVVDAALYWVPRPARTPPSTMTDCPVTNDARYRALGPAPITGLAKPLPRSCAVA